MKTNHVKKQQNTDRDLFLLLCFLFSGLVPLRAHATTGSDYHGEDLYRWTIYWHVDNSYDVSSNKLVINTYHGNTEFDWYDGHPYRVDEMYDGTRAEFDHPSYEIPYMASSQGDHTTTIDTGSPPLGIQYRIAGKGGNNCRWYLDKVEVEVIDPVKGTGLPAKRTLWKGMHWRQERSCERIC